MNPQSTARRPVALVTGGSQGIGAAIALQLAHDGFDVAITTLQDDGASDGASVAQIQPAARVRCVCAATWPTCTTTLVCSMRSAPGAVCRPAWSTTQAWDRRAAAICWTSAPRTSTG